MTIKLKILNYLKGRGYVNKETICKDLTQDDYLYSESVGRELRRLANSGQVIRQKKGKGSEYAIRTDNVERTSTLIQRQQERLEKEKHELDNKPPTLL